MSDDSKSVVAPASSGNPTTTKPQQSYRDRVRNLADGLVFKSEFGWRWVLRRRDRWSGEDGHEIVGTAPGRAACWAELRKRAASDGLRIIDEQNPKWPPIGCRLDLNA